MSKYEFDGDKVKKLYGAMQKLGYQQSLGEFEKGFYGKDNYQKRKAVYDVMTENGADLGSSYEDFIGRMRATSSAGSVSKSAIKPTNKTAETKTFEMPWEKKSEVAKRGDAILHGGGGAFLRDLEVTADEGYRLLSSKLVPERVEDPKSKRLVTKPKKYSVPESDVREGGSMVRMVDAYKTVDGRVVPIPSGITVPKSDEDDDFATEYIAGKIDRKEYKKKAKAKDNEAAIDNSQPTMESDEEFLYRTDKRYKEYRDKILNGDGDVDELSPETKEWYLQRVEAKIKDAEERQKKYADEINKNYDHSVDSNLARGFMPMSVRTASNMRPEVVLNQAAADKVEDELTDLYNVRDMLKGKDVGFFRKFGEFFSKPKNYTFGLAELNNNVNVLTYDDHRLVPEVAKAYAKADEAATMYSRSANLRAKAGSVTAEMVPFIVEIAASGGLSSAASKSVRGLVYAGGKALMKSAFKKGVERSLMKSLGAGAIRWGTRGIEWVAGATAAGAVVATTTGAGETAANITGRMLGHGAKQEDGSYAFEGGENTVGAILHGFTSQLIENATEFMGGGTEYALGKVASKLTKPLAKVGLGGVTDFFGRIAASPINKAARKTLRKFQIEGIPGEINEEYLGWAGHSMAGDGDAEWSDFADFKKHKELWATMALSVGAMGAFAASGHVPSLLKRRGRSLKMADRAAAGAFSDEEKWNALRDKLDGTDNNNVLRSLYDNVMQDKSLNGRERKAAMLYAGNLLAYRGANLGAIAGKRLALEQKRSNAEDARRAAMVEGTASSGAESVDEHELDGDDVVSSAFRQGYEETSAANAYLWAQELDAQEKRAQKELGLTEQELNEKFSSQNAGRTLNEMRESPEGTYTEKQKKAAFDYANTRAAYEGVVERTKDDIDSEIAYHHAIVDRQVHVNDGTLRPVSLFTSEKDKREDAFLVSGELGFEQNSNGETIISERKSDPTLIVSDAAGRTRMVSPSEIADAGFPIGVDEYKNALSEHIRQEMEERKYAEMQEAAEEAQANEIGEGKPEVPAVEGVSTNEEENETPEVSENGEQSNAFRGEFNVGDKFTTDEGTFEVVQLTEGEAPIVQNVETGKQFRPHSEGDLRAAVQSYTPAFIDGAENAEGVTTYNRVAQKETAPQNEAQEGSQQEQAYALSDIISARGERFYADAEGNINLSQIPETVLNVLELPNVPLRLTESMIEHIVERHGKELSVTSAEQAVRFVVDVMKRFDHVRKGNKKGTFVFSIENGRNKTGRRAVTLVVPEVQTEDTNPSPHVDNSSFLGVVTSGYESIEGLQKREILWEEGASVAPTAETASANVPTPSATQGGMTGGSASNQSISYREDTQSSAGVQEDTDISLENVQSALDKGEIEGITPQMAHDALYNDPDLETEEVDAIVENSRSTAQANLAKLQKAEIKPRKNESVVAFKKRKAAHIAALAHAEELVRFWDEVQGYHRNIGAQAMQEEEQAKQQREEEKAREQRAADEIALDGVSPEQIELRDGLVDIMRDAGMDVSVSDDEGQAVLDMTRRAMAETDAVREERVLQQVNAQFNAELQSQKEGRLRKGHVYNLGMPSAFLRSAGVADLPMQLTAQRLATKADKDYKNDHPFDLTDVKNLPKALAAPIAVFNSGTVGGTKVVLTELEDRKGNNFVVILRLDEIKGKKALDVKVNSVRSIYPKDNVQGILKWINEDHLLVAVDEKKAINWVGKQRSNSADVTKTANSFDDAAKVIKGFKNPKLSGENLRQQRKNSITEEMQSIKTKAQSDGTFMLAPNGEPTNLTERQWLQVRTEAFKKWFGDWENDPENASKVVDENGEPRVVYHLTSEQFTKFDLAKSRSQSDVQGFFFSSGTEDWSAMGDEKMAVFLNLRNPVEKPIVDQSKNNAGVAAREDLLKEGNDGAISFDEDESEEIEYLVLSPSQIKSATDNVGAFDKENDDIRLYRGQHGEVRGFAVGGRIYLDPKMASDETAIHEYTHLWADALRRVNAAEWENVKDLLRDTPVWDETKRLYPELADDEDALADEVLAQFSGKHGAKRLAEAREKAMSEADGVFDKAKVASVFDNVRQALKRFWKGVADFLGLHFTSAEEVADKVLSDLLNGVNPNDVIANTKDSIREQRIDNDTREKMQRSVDDLRVEVREGYEKAVRDWKYKIKEQWQDSMLALKTLQDELEKKGAKIEEWENAYWAENRMSSMNEEEMKAYTRDYFKPIVAAQMAASKALPQELTDKLNAMDAHLREFEKMNAEEKKRNAVGNYMMLKHGLERNRVLAMRDAIDAQWKNPSEASSVWRAYNEDAGNRENRRLLQEGKRSFEEFLQVDDAIRAHYAGEEYLKNREKDYSGLTSMTTEELTELKDVENAALQLVKEAEDAAGAELSALWDKVNKATRESVEKLYKSGLLTPAAYSQMTTMFQWYVPLRGFAEETSDEVYDYVDQRNGNGMGAVLKGADGRKSKADSPIAHIGSMAERSIVQGNRNLMKQHFYRMVMDHPNDLVSMGEIYLHHNEVTDEWEMMTPTHSPNATPEQIAEETRAFEERMQELVQQEPDNYLRLREHPDVPYRVLGSNLGEHQVLVKVLGRDKLLTVNGDPRVAQAVNGLFNPDAISNDFLKRLRNLNNFLAQMATQRNPEFIFRNLIRDRFYAMEAARVKDGAIDPQYMGRLQKNWISAVGQVVGLTARYNSGTLDMNDAQDRMFYEFMMNGGATGVTRLLNPEEYKGEIADIAKEMQRGEFHPAKVAKLVTKYVDLFGSCSEAITRFATYRTSRELGRSVARSVWDAKEITTNFNKKGAGSKAIRKDDGRWLRMSGETASYFKNFVIFTNANVQGFHNQWQLAKKNPKRFIAHFVAKWVALGFAMPLINNFLAGLFGGDDDHYQDLPETARRNSLCLFVPKVGWVKIPLGFGLRSAYAMGGLLSEQLFYPKGDYTSMMRSLFDIAMDLMPLSMGSSEQGWWLNVVPSSLRPLAENIANKDWTGRPIVNENINEHWPEYRRANNRTSNISIKISEALNNMTGGDEYTPGFINLNPSQFEHIALGLLSGVGTLVGNTYETTANVIRGEEVDPRHIPFLKDFFSTSGGVVHASAVKRDFYALKDEYEKTKVRVKGYEKEEADGKNDPESVARRQDFRKNSKEYKRYEVMNKAVSEVNSIRRYMKEAASPEEVKKLEADQQKVMEDALKDVRAIK